MYTCQEIYDHMPIDLFENSIKSKTIFLESMPHFNKSLYNFMDQKFLGNFNLRKDFEQLMKMRQLIKQKLSDPEVKTLMRNSGDIKSLEIVLQTETA